MKCPMCDGRRTMFTREQPGVGTQFGEIKLVVCPKCNGTGEVEVIGDSITDVCDKCGGTGDTINNIPPTNEEWFCELSTEEKARFLEMICYSAWGDKKSRFKDMADYTDWMDWLKEIHQ